MGTVYLERLEYPKRVHSYMSCVLGTAKYLGCAESESWLYGASGIAFFSHLHPGGVCESCVTDWDVGPCIRLTRNAGIAQEGVRGPDGSVPQAVKESLSQGIPLSAWGEDDCEEVLLCGYAETPQGDTFTYLSPSEAEGSHPWSGHFGPATEFSLIPPADDRTTVKMALQCAVEMNRDPNEFIGDSDAVMGHEAFRAAAEWLDKKEILGRDLGFNLQAWEEDRRHASSFLDEASSRLEDKRLTEPLSEAAGHFRTVHGELKAIVDTFGDSIDTMPEGMHEEYAGHLYEACEAERKAIASVEAVLKLMD